MAGNMTGRLLNNRYLVNERIGIGGMAEVDVGTDNVLGRTVAIKVMLPQYAEDATFTVRFKQEAAAAANLQSRLSARASDARSGTLLLLADRRVPAGDLMKLMALARKAGLKHVQVAERRE